MIAREMFRCVAALVELAALVLWPSEVAAQRTTARSRAAVRRVQSGQVRDLAGVGLRFGGYDFFERRQRPPNVEAHGGRYVFGPS